MRVCVEKKSEESDIIFMHDGSYIRNERIYIESNKLVPLRLFESLTAVTKVVFKRRRSYSNSADEAVFRVLSAF